MEIYNFNNHCNTLESVVERINGGPVQGFEQLTADMLAASYAADAAVEAGYTGPGSVEAQLDFISDAGAVFCKDSALEQAMKMVAALESGSENWV